MFVRTTKRKYWVNAIEGKEIISVADLAIILKKLDRPTIIRKY